MMERIIEVISCISSVLKGDQYMEGFESSEASYHLPERLDAILDLLDLPVLTPDEERKALASKIDAIGRVHRRSNCILRQAKMAVDKFLSVTCGEASNDPR